MYFWTPFWNKKQLHSGSFPFWWKNVGCFQCAESLQINTTTPIFLTIWHGQVTKKYALMFFLWEICPGFSFLWCATFCSSFCFCSLPSKRVRCSIHVEVVVKSCKQIWKRNEKLRTKEIVEKNSGKLHEIDAEHICDVIITVAFFASYQSVGVFAKVTCQWTNQTSEEKRVYMITSITCPKRIA